MQALPPPPEPGVVEPPAVAEVVDESPQVGGVDVDAAAHDQGLSHLRGCASPVEEIEHRTVLGAHCDRFGHAEGIAQHQHLLPAAALPDAIHFA